MSEIEQNTTLEPKIDINNDKTNSTKSHESINQDDQLNEFPQKSNETTASTQEQNVPNDLPKKTNNNKENTIDYPLGIDHQDKFANQI